MTALKWLLGSLALLGIYYSLLLENPLPKSELLNDTTSLALKYGVPEDELNEFQAKNSIEKVKPFIKNISAWKSRSSFLTNQLIEQLEYDTNHGVSDGSLSISKAHKFNDYSVANVVVTEQSEYLASGNLYYPNLASKYPLIMSPHDHSDQGRFDEDVQIRCAGLARLGAIVFTWDMVGWGESGGDHETENVKSLQLKIASKILTVFLNSEYIDGNKIGYTGSSGGAALGMNLSALDKRFDAVALVSMISSLSVGNCHCEIAGFHYQTSNYQTNNIELTGLIAPRPLLLVSNGRDWTRAFPRLDLPFLKELYTLHDASKVLFNSHFESEGHDFGPSKRAVVYEFFSQQFDLPSQNSEQLEKFISIRSRKDLEARPYDPVRRTIY